jgi:hypothetical protein
MVAGKPEAEHLLLDCKKKNKKKTNESQKRYIIFFFRKFDAIELHSL